MRHLLYIFGSLGAIGIGANLHYQIASSGNALTISLAVLSCIFILVGLYFTCKLWYVQGSIDGLRSFQKCLKIGGNNELS